MKKRNLLHTIYQSNMKYIKNYSYLIKEASLNGILLLSILFILFRNARKLLLRIELKQNSMKRFINSKIKFE